MTKDDIIQMAREAGLYTKCEVYSAVPFDQLLERFASLAVAAEREACAKLCERDDSMRWSGAAAAIRARSHP